MVKLLIIICWSSWRNSWVPFLAISVHSSPLEDKFIFLRVKHPRDTPIKCSGSILANSVIVSKGFELLISDKLRPEVLISPSGAYEFLKNRTNTFCKGSFISILILYWFHVDITVVKHTGWYEKHMKLIVIKSFFNCHLMKSK